MTDLRERDGELVAIRAGLDASLAGDGRCPVVEGPAGIGKSSLLAVARVEAAWRGFRLLSAAGGESERASRTAWSRQLFAATVTDDSTERRWLAGAAELARPVIDLDHGGSGADEGGESHLLEVLHDLYWLTVNLATDGPSSCRLTRPTGATSPRCGS